MFWKYGNYTHPNNEVLVTAFTARRLYTPRRLLDRIIKTAVIEGEIIAEGQTAIEARRLEVDTAYASAATGAFLLKDTADGGQATYSMANPRLLDFVWLQEEHKAHFATGLPFRAVIESEEINLDSGLLSFSETITKIGNGAERRVWPELDNGESIPQIVSTKTNVTILQSGEAFALGGWPVNVGDPIYGTPQLDNPSQTVSHTLEDSDIRPVYAKRWNYVFTFNTNETPPFPQLD